MRSVVMDEEIEVFLETLSPRKNVDKKKIGFKLRKILCENTAFETPKTAFRKWSKSKYSSRVLLKPIEIRVAGIAERVEQHL